MNWTSARIFSIFWLRKLKESDIPVEARKRCIVQSDGVDQGLPKEFPTFQDVAGSSSWTIRFRGWGRWIWLFLIITWKNDGVHEEALPEWKTKAYGNRGVQFGHGKGDCSISLSKVDQFRDAILDDDVTTLEKLLDEKSVSVDHVFLWPDRGRNGHFRGLFLRQNKMRQILAGTRSLHGTKWFGPYSIHGHFSWWKEPEKAWKMISSNVQKFCCKKDLTRYYTKYYTNTVVLYYISTT